MNVEVIDVDGAQLVVRSQDSTSVLDVISEHDTCVGHALSGALNGTGIDTLRNLSTDAVLVAFYDATDAEPLERTIF